MTDQSNTTSVHWQWDIVVSLGSVQLFRWESTFLIWRGRNVLRTNTTLNNPNNVHVKARQKHKNNKIVDLPACIEVPQPTVPLWFGG